MRVFKNIVDNMIRDVRPLQSTDQNRLREDHKHGNTDDFARFLSGMDTEEETDDTTFVSVKKRKPVVSQSLIKDDSMWSSFFARLAETPTNDRGNQASLFAWGENRENAKRHTQVARQSAMLQDNTPLHILNEKI